MRQSNLYHDDENHLCAFMKPRIRGVTSEKQKRRQAMSRNILLEYSGSLVGVPPSPRPTACASGRTRLSAWLCAPCGRFLLHIRAGEGRRILRRQEISMTGKKFYSSESFLVPSFVMVSCPCCAGLGGLPGSTTRMLISCSMQKSSFGLIDVSQSAGRLNHSAAHAPYRG